MVIGVTSVGPADESVTASVKTFLFDWEQQKYPDAASMTTGDSAIVTASLRSVYRQLGAEDLVLSMGSISAHGNLAHASFFASFDLGRGGLTWLYRGSFTLRRGPLGWRVVWSPSVIVPGLGVGERVAVLTTTPRRAVLLDAHGRSLIQRSGVIELGVVPYHVKNPARTARLLAKATGLPQSNAVEMTGQIEAAPPRQFLELVTLKPGRYRQLRRALRQVPDLRHWRVITRLFDSEVPVITGDVATETAKTLIDDGEPDRPGTTVGLSGLQQAFQSKLAGRPTTEIVVQNSAGKQLKILHSWLGSPSADVRTTIDGGVQAAADNALTGVGLSAAIVAVRAGGGQILAVATHTKPGMPAVNPLAGRYLPGQSFTIVSTAALLAAGTVTANAPVTCVQKNLVGGQTFANTPAGPSIGTQSFREAFSDACSTAFAVLSLVLTSRELTGAARNLGIGGTSWKLPLSTFPGKISSLSSNVGALASETVGLGSVLVSPLGMALAAGAVDSGTWRGPQLVPSLPTRQPTRSGLSRSGLRRSGLHRSGLSRAVDLQLRDLMRTTVRSGAAKAANVPGTAVFGQVGTAPLRGHHGLHAIWFVGFRGHVAFAVIVFARSASFALAAQIAGAFAAGLPAGS